MEEAEKLTPQDVAKLEAASASKPEEKPAEQLDYDDDGRAVMLDRSKPPPWALVPADAGARKMPKKIPVSFFRFRAEWTDTPEKGDRQCVIWNLAVGDEKVAAHRAGDTNSITSELAKQTVRAVDGAWADYGTPRSTPYGIDTFWDDIGYKCRQLVINYWVKTHSLTPTEKVDFLANCQAVRVAQR